MIPRIHVAVLKQKLDAGEPVFLLDVREPWEHEHCYIGESLLIPLGDLPQRTDEITVAGEPLIVVYCHHGIRSLNGASILQRAGFANVASLHGGIEAWSLLVDSSVPRY